MANPTSWQDGLGPTLGALSLILGVLALSPVPALIRSRFRAWWPEDPLEAHAEKIYTEIGNVKTAINKIEAPTKCNTCVATQTTDRIPRGSENPENPQSHFNRFISQVIRESRESARQEAITEFFNIPDDTTPGPNQPPTSPVSGPSTLSRGFHTENTTPPLFPGGHTQFNPPSRESETLYDTYSNPSSFLFTKNLSQPYQTQSSPPLSAVNRPPTAPTTYGRSTFDTQSSARHRHNRTPPTDGPNFFHH